MSLEKSKFSGLSGTNVPRGVSTIGLTRSGIVLLLGVGVYQTGGGVTSGDSGTIGTPETTSRCILLFL